MQEEAARATEAQKQREAERQQDEVRYKQELERQLEVRTGPMVGVGLCGVRRDRRIAL